VKKDSESTVPNTMCTTSSNGSLAISNTGKPIELSAVCAPGTLGVDQ